MIREVPSEYFQASLPEEDHAFLRDSLNKVNFGDLDSEKSIETELRPDCEVLMLNAQAWAAEVLQLNTGKRVVSSDKIFVLSAEKFYALLRENGQNKDIESANAFHDPVTGSTILKKGADRKSLLRNFNHEYMHQLSGRTFMYYEDTEEHGSKLEATIEGFNETRSASLEQLNEWITESMNFETLQRHKNITREDLLTNENRIAPAYLPGVILFDAACKKIAEYSNQNPHQVKLEFYRAYIEGRTVALKIFEHVFGKGTLAKLARLHSSEGEDFRNVAIGMGLGEEVESQMRLYNQGRTLALSGGIMLQWNHPEQPSHKKH